MRCERGQPGVDDQVDDSGTGEGKQCFASRGRMRRYDGVRQPFCIHSFGEPIGMRLQGQDIGSAQNTEAHLVAGCLGQFVQHRQGAHHRLRIGARPRIRSIRWRSSATADRFGSCVPRSVRADATRRVLIPGGARWTSANWRSTRSRSTCARRRRRIPSGSRSPCWSPTVLDPSNFPPCTLLVCVRRGSQSRVG